MQMWFTLAVMSIAQAFNNVAGYCIPRALQGEHCCRNQAG